MQIHDLDPGDGVGREAAAALLVRGFEGVSTSWRSIAEARQTVAACLDEEDGLAPAAREGDRLLGWIGAQPTHGAHGWELHPLVVDPRSQRRGIGRSLVGALEDRVWRAGGRTIWLGSDDELGTTSLHGRDLFPDLLGALASVRATGKHPLPFYRSCGYVLCGALPDASGPGRPDLLMCKRLVPPRGPKDRR